MAVEHVTATPLRGVFFSHVSLVVPSKHCAAAYLMRCLGTIVLVLRTATFRLRYRSLSRSFSLKKARTATTPTTTTSAINKPGRKLNDTAAAGGAASGEGVGSIVGIGEGGTGEGVGP